MASIAIVSVIDQNIICSSFFNIIKQMVKVVFWYQNACQRCELEQLLQRGSKTVRNNKINHHVP